MRNAEINLNSVRSATEHNAITDIGLGELGISLKANYYFVRGSGYTQ